MPDEVDVSNEPVIDDFKVFCLETVTKWPYHTIQFGKPATGVVIYNRPEDVPLPIHLLTSGAEARPYVEKVFDVKLEEATMSGHYKGRKRIRVEGTQTEYSFDINLWDTAELSMPSFE